MHTSIKRTFFHYVSLNIIGMLGLSCYILADTFFIARGVGTNGLAALNLAIPIYSFIHGTGLMLGMGGGARFSISKSKTIFSQAVCYGLIFACFFIILGVFFTCPLSTLLGADADTLQFTVNYLRVILCFSPMFLLNNIVLCFVRNDGDPKLAMMGMLIGSFSNVILDYIFIFPFGMGMFGAALATGIAPVISLGVLSAHFVKKKNTFLFLRCKLKFKTFLDIFSLGFSALVTEVSSGIIIIVFNGILLRLAGNMGVAAYGIIANIALVSTAVFTGIAQGIQPLLSLYHGMKNSADTKKVLKYAFISAVVLAVLIYVLVAVFANSIVSIFNKDANVQLAQIATSGLRIYFTAFIFAGINILCATYYSAIGKPKNAFIISLLRGLFVIVPAAFVLSALFGITGVWLTMIFTELIVFVVAMVLFRASSRS